MGDDPVAPGRPTRTGGRAPGGEPPHRTPLTLPPSPVTKGRTNFVMNITDAGRIMDGAPPGTGSSPLLASARVDRTPRPPGAGHPAPLAVTNGYTAMDVSASTLASIPTITERDVKRATWVC